MTSVGGKRTAVFGTIGGNLLKVTDHAEASFQGIRVGGGARSGQCNQLVFSDGAKVNMTGLTVSSDSNSAYPGGSNTIEILSGAVVTNTGSFTFGGNNKACGYNTLVVSNAEFHIEEGYVFAGVNYIMRGRRSVFRLSGENAKFSSGKNMSSFFSGDGPNCTFIVENGANFTFPGRFAYNSAQITTSGETLLVRSGATVSTSSELTTTGNSTNNTVFVDGGNLRVGGYLYIYGYRAGLVVQDGDVRAESSICIGKDGDANSTNAMMTVRGRSPKVYAGVNLLIQNGSTLRIELPPEGYADGYATSETPVITAGDSATNRGIKPSEDSSVELVGAEAMLEYFKTHDKRGEYVLMRTNKNLAELDGLAEKLQQDMPDGMTVASRIVDNKWELVLSVKPHTGAMLIIR